MAFALAGGLLLPACDAERSGGDETPGSPSPSSSSALRTTAPKNSSPPSSAGRTSRPFSSTPTDADTKSRPTTGGGGHTSSTKLVPVITFPNKSVQFNRRAIDLGGKIRPKGIVRYAVIPGGIGTEHDDQCHIVGGRLMLWRSNVPAADRDHIAPSLPTSCLIEASAPASEAKRQRAKIDVAYPNFDVSVEPVDTVLWSEHHQITVTVHERSGSAYSMFVGGADKCTGGRSPAHGSSTPGTVRYKVTVTLDEPGTDGYTCSMTARAGPEDLAFNRGAEADFEITVKP